MMGFRNASDIGFCYKVQGPVFQEMDSSTTPFSPYRHRLAQGVNGGMGFNIPLSFSLAIRQVLSCMLFFT